MSEQSVILGTLALVGIALVCGIVVREPKSKLSIAVGGAAFWFLYCVYNAPSVREGFGRFVFLFILCFVLPFSLGQTLGKRIGPK